MTGQEMSITDGPNPPSAGRAQRSGSAIATEPHPDIDQALELADLLDQTITESGRPFMELVTGSPVLLVFLRHAGCTFCREALGDIAKNRGQIEATGVRIVLVHMGDRAEIQDVIARYGLADLERVCDSNKLLYQAFGLKQGNVFQLFGLKVWWRSLVAGLFRGHGAARPAADATQMPGVFLVEQGLVARRFRHKSAADRPSYVELARTNQADGSSREGLSNQ